MYPSGLSNGPPSPPETHSSHFGPAPTHSSFSLRQMATPGASFENVASIFPAPLETPTSRFRRGSSVGYHSPSHRDARERTASVASRFLVVVAPPPSVVQEHGSLGHTLSMGPANRLHQGLIMPLFPTMYGQLTAIAREFNFPSASGVCLYYCHTEQGITMTPRLSDDVWQTIWGLTEPSLGGSEKRSPVVGKLEFDIDLGQARWYTAWLASRRKPSAELTLHQAPVTAPPLHFRGENKFTFPQTSSEDGSVEQLIPQRSAPVVTRHAPRKLSLVDRFDAPQLEARAARPSNSPPTALSAHVLSPITQQEEPKTARLDLNDRVKSWRASAITSPPVEILSESPVPEVVSSPRADSPASQSSFHLEDYAFSISSAGPDDSSSIASYHQDYLPSVHLCDRVNGSVCMTESYCTSPGPSDYEITFEQYEESYLLTPDIAYRMLEECPPTPMTATSWGPPSPAAMSFSSVSYCPSLDLGHRAYFSRPPTPCTATSWGPQSFDGSWSAASQQSSFSIHLCNRGEFSTPPTPQTATSWGPASCPLSPVSPFRLPSPDIAHRTFEDSDEWDMRASMLASWRRALADDSESLSQEFGESVTTETSPLLPSADVVEESAVVPRDAEETPRIQERHEAHEAKQPEIQPWNHSWPYWNAGVILVKNSRSSFLNVLPLSSPPKGRGLKSSASTLSEDPVQTNRSQYPFFALYSPVYPNFDLYPSVAGSPGPQVDNGDMVKPRSLPVLNSNYAGYPSFVLYPPVYPYFELYPSTAGNTSIVREEKSKPQAVSPSLTWTSGYPSFTLYPSVYPHNLSEIYPGLALKFAYSQPKAKPPCSEDPVAAFVQYPTFCLYRPVYPDNMISIYPSVGNLARKEPGVRKEQQVVEPYTAALNTYPTISLYPLVYPHNVDAIYPAHGKADRDSGPVLHKKDQNDRPVLSWAEYPYFNLYPAAYPWFDLYPKPLTVEAPPEATWRAVYAVPGDKAMTPSYPSLVIYAPQYPYFDLYPSLHTLDSSPPRAVVDTFTRPLISTRAPSHYPYFDLYPAVYPHFSIWPSNPVLTVNRPTPPIPSNSKRKSSRLTHSELHAVVMMASAAAEVDLLLSAFPKPPQSSHVHRPELRHSRLPRLLSPSLSRSSTLPIRHSPQVEASSNRASVYSPELVRTRGLRHNTMSTINHKGPAISHRMSIWENNIAEGPPLAQTTKPTARRRDSIVVQRIKALNFQSGMPR